MPRSSFTEEERQAFYRAIAKLDPKGDLVVCDPVANSLSYSKKIKSYEKISGKPTDEELTRALILVNLIQRYGYSQNRIEIENRFAIGGRNPKLARAVETDIVILDDKGEIESLCEIKKIHDYKGTDDSSIKKQLFDPLSVVKYSKAKYLYHLSVDVPLNDEHFPLRCIGIDRAAAKDYDAWTKQGRPTYYADIKRSGEKPIVETIYIKDPGTGAKKVKDLDDSFGIDKLRRSWRKLWNEIWGGTLEDNKLFENFNKVLLAKIYDERKTKTGEPYSFQRKVRGGDFQTVESLALDVDLLYRRAFREYLSKDKSVELKSIHGIDLKTFSPDLIAKCVDELKEYSFQKNRYKNVDVLGEFYEMVIREAFKQTKGLYLTHPNIVLFILAALDVEALVEERLKTPVEDSRYRLPFVIDPSCGTGTFLIHYMKYVQKHVEANSKRIAGGDDDVTDFVERFVLEGNAYKWVVDYVYGIDREHTLATACQINNILHGDGSTNIFSANGLADLSEYSKLEVTGGTRLLSAKPDKPTAYYERPALNRFDVVISNPPFNVPIGRETPESAFTIKGKSEAFFLERWYQLLRPGGRLGVVLPESFFSVHDDVEGRLFLYRHFTIRAIVSLPNFAFAPHTGTNTSLLFATKKSEAEELAYAKEWDKAETEFESRLSRIQAFLAKKKSDLLFEKADQAKKNSVSKWLADVREKVDAEFDGGEVVLPYWTQEEIADAERFGILKESIRDATKKIRNQWILRRTAGILDMHFFNCAVDNLGYKAGKKGSKDKPNELLHILGGTPPSRIYNLKYAHGWDTIVESDLKTILGKLRQAKIWQ